MALTAFLHGKIYTMQSKAADVAPFTLLKDVSDIVMAEIGRASCRERVLRLV